MIASVTPSCSNERRNRIKKLSPLLINQLAAGEVVTRPASVVKELVENAIDAGATEVTIRITQGGMGAIEVSDNGYGIHADDMVMAVTRFATSKIADVAQLQGIATLGFRGEALAATAAVSRLTLRSSSNHSGVGRELGVAGILEDTPKLVPVVQPQGTTVIVKDLYFNVPARRGNLKSISTEFAHIEAVVKQLALVASDVAIGLWHNDKRRFYFAAVNNSGCYSNLQSPVEGTGSQMMQIALSRLKMIVPDLANGSGLPGFLDEDNSLCLQPLTISLTGLLADSIGFQQKNLQVDVLQAATSQTTAFEMDDFEKDSFEKDSFEIDGFEKHSFELDNNNTDTRNQNNIDNIAATHTGIYGFLLPYLQPSSSLYKLIYINGRLVKDKHIAHSLRTATSAVTVLHDLGYVLFFQLPQTWLNLNVHPSKQCIKIQDLANISAHLEMGVKSSLQTWQKRLPDDMATRNLQSTMSPSVLSSSTPSSSTPSSSTLSSSTWSTNQLPRLTPFNNVNAVNESQQVYLSPKQSFNALLTKVRVDTVADNSVINPVVRNDLATTDVNRTTVDGDTNQQTFVKSQASIESFVCLYRVSASALNRSNLTRTNFTPILSSMPQGKVAVKSEKQTQIEVESESELDSVIVLVQWQAAFYVFDQQTLLNEAATATAIDGLFVQGQSDGSNVEELTTQLTPSIAAMSPAERAAFGKQAIFKLSLAELTALMLQQGL